MLKKRTTIIWGKNEITINEFLFASYKNDITNVLKNSLHARSGDVKALLINIKYIVLLHNKLNSRHPSKDTHANRPDIENTPFLNY